MARRQTKSAAALQVKARCPLAAATLFLGLATAYGQRYDVSALAGGMFGGTVKLEQFGVSPNPEAHVGSSFSFGLAGGFRFDADDFGDVCTACNLVQFRWLRQSTHLALEQDPLVPAPVAVFPGFRPNVTLNYFLADFVREWPVEDVRFLRPFLSASLGAAHMSTPASGATRFVFGVGTGLKVFPKPHWGILFDVEYLPIVMNVKVQRVVCAGGCIFLLGGGIMNRFQFTIGPTFRF